MEFGWVRRIPGIVKGLVCVVCLLEFCSNVVAQNAYDELSKHVKAFGETVKDNGECFAAFNAAWEKADAAYREMMLAYSSNGRELESEIEKTESNEKEIRQNEERIDALKKITRDEFEERADFEKRQGEAKSNIERLSARNAELRNENKRLRDSVRERRKMEKPKVDLAFVWQAKTSMPMGKEDVKIGQYDVDQKVFPCCFSQSSEPLCDQFGDFSVKRTLCFDSYGLKIGPFKSAAEAKEFKQAFESGKKRLDLNFSFSISVTTRVERVLIKPSKRVFTWGECCEWFVRGGEVLFKGAAILNGEQVQCEPWSSVPAAKYSEPVYKNVDTYFMDCCFRPLDGPNVILTKKAGATIDASVKDLNQGACRKSKEEIERSFRDHIAKSGVKQAVAKMFAVMKDRPCDDWSVKKILSSDIAGEKVRGIKVGLKYELYISSAHVSAVVTIDQIDDVRFDPGTNELVYDMQNDNWKVRNAAEFLEGVRKSLVAKMATSEVATGSLVNKRKEITDEHQSRN